MCKPDHPTIAVCGNVNTEEITTRRLVEEGAIVDGYLLFPNEAFAEYCRNIVLLCAEDEAFRAKTLMDRLEYGRYDAILLGPDFMVRTLSDGLRSRGIPHIGATNAQLDYETDKTLICRVFPKESGILPRHVVVTTTEWGEIARTLEPFGDDFVIKFTGDYAAAYGGSPVGRVRIGRDTFRSLDDVFDFVAASVRLSGTCLIQERIRGHEYSANYAVDANGGLFRIGENICYKHRYDGDTGPLCDGTGSVTFGNTLPFLNDQDAAFMEERIVRLFAEALHQHTGEPLCTLINVDCMKATDGRIVLFEINVREAGGHTMANLVAGLRTPLSDILIALQQGKLNDLTPAYDSRCSLVVSAYPPYYPHGASDEDLVVVDVPTDIPEDVLCYTGWVDVLERKPGYRRMRLRNSPTLMFQHTAPTLNEARARLYGVMKRIVPAPLEYRTDIGLIL